MLTASGVAFDFFYPPWSHLQGKKAHPFLQFVFCYILPPFWSAITVVSNSVSFSFVIKFDSTAELSYLGRPELVLGLAHINSTFEPDLIKRFCCKNKYISLGFFPTPSPPPNGLLLCTMQVYCLVYVELVESPQEGNYVGEAIKKIWTKHWSLRKFIKVVGPMELNPAGNKLCQRNVFFRSLINSRV